MDNKNDLYSVLTRFGSFYPIKLRFSILNNLVADLEKNYTWAQYNPSKQIHRYGLSVTSLDGKMTGIPDLDSFYEYYSRTGIRLHESDFKTKTEIYKYFSNWLDPFGDAVGRTHVIKLPPGGFFPWHRDCKNLNISAFRLFLPIKFSETSFVFLLEDKMLNFKDGTFYFIDTSKSHCLFNLSDTDACYFLVSNIDLTEDAVNTVCSKLVG